MLTILLPPSEGKAAGGGRPRWAPASGRYGRRLAPVRREVITALAGVDGGDGSLLGVRGDALERARAANRSLLGAPTLPAWQRFTGVVWEHLDVGSLPEPARERASGAVVVVSALAGLSALDDPLPDFRLKLSVTLPSVGRLGRRWREPVTEALARSTNGGLVIDLLPHEHAAAVDFAALSADVLRVRFVGHDARVAGHTAKAAKVLFDRALLETDDPERAVGRWRHPHLRAEVSAVR